MKNYAVCAVNMLIRQIVRMLTGARFAYNYAASMP